jgi:hypothetical protein
VHDEIVSERLKEAKEDGKTPIDSGSCIRSSGEGDLLNVLSIGEHSRLPVLSLSLPPSLSSTDVCVCHSRKIG